MGNPTAFKGQITFEADNTLILIRSLKQKSIDRGMASDMHTTLHSTVKVFKK